MSETPGRGYLPPTVPAPGQLRRQWPTFNYFPGQWQGKQPYIMAPSSPQSESMDLSSRPEVNGGGEVNGTSVSVIAPNPLIAEDKPGKLPIESARGFETNPEPLVVPKTLSLPNTEKVQDPPSENIMSPTTLTESITPVEETPLPQPEIPVEAPTPPSESAAVPIDEQKQGVTEPKHIVDVDHVESLLENMFKGEIKPSVIVANCSLTPVLTEDKVVEILEDSPSPVKEESFSVDEDCPLVIAENTPIKEEPKESEFMEVESELEKMFAGIEEEKPVPSSLTDDDSSVLPSIPSGTQSEKKMNKKPSKPRQRKSTDSAEGRKRKVKRREKQRPKKTKREKDNSNDSTILSRSIRCPYVHIEGSKEAPQYVGVVNSGGKEEEEKDRNERRKHQSLGEGRVRGTNLYSSTLSSRYNSQNVDTMWVCIFCKLRAHCEGGLGGEAAGDLFGPYILNFPKTNDVDNGIPCDKEVSAEQKRKGGGKAASLRATGCLESFITNFSKKSKKSSTINLDEIGGEKEVWIHEKCATWAPGIYLAGPHLVGLAEAISASAVTKCSYCGDYGACIGCVRRGCHGRVHYGCGLSSGWHLNNENFLSLCPIHNTKKKNENIKNES